MTTLDFTDSEPPIKTTKAAQANALTGNAAFYERLQGQTKKKGIERYGWVALPIAAVAILGVVAATSTPHSSADDVVGAPGQTAAATPAGGVKIAQASNDDATPVNVQSPAAIRAKIDSAPAAVPAPSSAPAPVRVAKRAPAPRSDTVTTVPAAAAPVTRAAPAPAPAQVNPPAATVAPPAAAPADSQAPAVSAAPAPQAPSVTEQPAPAPSAPADTAPAQ